MNLREVKSVKRRNVIGASLAILIGIFGFLSVYGFRILDITYTDWIKNAGGDLAQSYYGWMFFRHSRWYWPIGLMEGASADLTSIIYIDSVPLFNVIFKAFSFLLPETCQFFGIWGLTCFALSGYLGYRLIFLATQRNSYAVCGSVFFVFCNIMVQRLYTHTALAANWIIMLGILVILKGNSLSPLKRILSWVGVFFICVSVNIYYIPILGVLMTLYCIYLLAKKGGWKQSVLIFFCSVFSVFLTFYLYGGFYHINATNAAPNGLGYYCANLNSLFNPMETMLYISGFGRVLKTLPMAVDGQYEGYAYLGAGLLLLGVFAIAGLCFQSPRKVVALLKEHRLVFILSLLAVFILFLLSLGTLVSVNSRTLFHIPYPDFILKILAVFRSTGRFLWGVWDIYAVIAILAVYRLYNKKSSVFILCICLVMQLYDFADMRANRFQIYAHRQASYQSQFQSDLWDTAASDKSQIFFFNEQRLTLRNFYDFADIALEHNMGINDFYYSRRADKTIDAAKETELSAIRAKNASPDKLYIFDSPANISDLFGILHFYIIDDCLIGSKNAIPNMEELLSAQAIPLSEFESSPAGYSIPKGFYWVNVIGDNVYDAKLTCNKNEISMRRIYENTVCESVTFSAEQETNDISVVQTGQAESVVLYQLQMR